MASDRWDSATVEEKLELLRRDIMRIRDAQNLLAQEFAEFRRREQVFGQAFAALIRSLPRNEAVQLPTLPEVHEAGSNNDHAGGEDPNPNLSAL